MNTVRTFVSPSEGMEMRCCSDRLAVEAAKGRFAVADGVSSSHLPGLWAGLLCLDFVTERDPADRWLAGLDAERRTVLRQLWEEDCGEMESNADAAGARRLRRTRSLYGHGASTLAGITVVGGELSYCIVGDTCLWVRDASGRTSCIPSGVLFSSLTDALSSDWDTHPEPVTGRMPLARGVLVLATDALSDWIGRMEADGGTQSACSRGSDPGRSSMTSCGGTGGWNPAPGISTTTMSRRLSSGLTTRDPALSR